MVFIRAFYPMLLEPSVYAIILAMEHFLKSRYKTGGKISENPFSVTYSGFFVATKKPVVIKIYKRGTLNSQIINRMKQKVREFAALNHHGIAKLIDGDYGWQGYYYVREYIEGKSLAELLANKQELGLEQALKITQEACRALEVAHAKGIIHGGLKPENVFLDQKGIVKLTDFVIEGEIKEALPQKILSLMDNGYYASTEELSGLAATSQSDIYALALVLAQLLLAGKLPLAQGFALGLKKLKQPGLFLAPELAALPRYLQEILSRALQAEPALRFASMSELRESLERKSLISQASPQQELITIFENTVTQFGGEEIKKEDAALEEVGQVKIKWAKEKHRNWILVLVLALSIVSGLAYAFLFAR